MFDEVQTKIVTLPTRFTQDFNNFPVRFTRDLNSSIRFTKGFNSFL